jgi:hypothetical protein
VEFSKEMGRRKIKEIRYLSKGVYATLMSDIPKLSEIVNFVFKNQRRRKC